MALGMYLSVVRSAGIPVNINLSFFHQSMDRLILMGCVISKDFHCLSDARVHFEQFQNTPISYSFGLIATNQPFWQEEFDTNVSLRGYFRIGAETGKTLVSLNETMTQYLLSKAVQTKDDPVGEWLAKELDRILNRKSPTIDSDNELSVFATAFRGYRWLIQKRKDDIGVQTFIFTLKKILFNCDNLAIETVERIMYKVIGQFFAADVNKPGPEKSRKNAQRKVEEVHFKAVVESEMANVEPVREEFDKTFARIVRYARSQLPFGRPEQIFTLAKQMYYSEDRLAFAERANKIILVPYVNSTGAKQNLVRRVKSDGGKWKDPLKGVKKRNRLKRKDKRARFAPIVRG